MPKQLEIGTRFQLGESGGIWTIGGYVYYEDDLWYVCFNEDGNQRDEYHEDIEGWIRQRGKQ